MQFPRHIVPYEQFPQILNRRFGPVFLGWILLLPVFAGCRLGVSSVAPSPWSDDEQREALLKIAPVGTPRDEAVKRLTAAGVGGSFGIRDSVYYCDSWQREEGQNWHLDLAVLFDESGRLYRIRPAQFLTPAGDDAISASEGVAGDSEKTQAMQPTRNTSPPTANPARQGRRTPLAQDAALPTM